MIAANGVVARFLDAKGLPSLRRVLRSPERWDRIAALAAGLGERLPRDASAVALEAFLARRRQADPARFPDLSLSVVKLLGAGEYVLELLPYDEAELAALARHCTEQEDAAAKVERQVRKSAAALLLAGRAGERFEAIVTCASAKGTWVRIARPAVEGKVVRGFEGLDVGDRVHVTLLRTDVEQGFIDFERSAETA